MVSMLPLSEFLLLPFLDDDEDDLFVLVDGMLTSMFRTDVFLRFLFASLDASSHSLLAASLFASSLSLVVILVVVVVVAGVIVVVVGLGVVLVFIIEVGLSIRLLSASKDLDSVRRSLKLLNMFDSDGFMCMGVVTDSPVRLLRKK